MVDTARYDRQIRLWGEEGQTSIQSTSVCVLGSSGLSTEILKNLILPGIKSFHIIDDAVVDITDLGNNFFLEMDDVGKPRAEAVVRLLSELNPSVKGSFSKQNPALVEKKDLLNYSIVISTCLPTSHLLPIADFLFDSGVPLINARICGLFGYFRLSFNTHSVYNAHVEYPMHDLRLDQPLPEVLKLNAANDLTKMSYTDHSHTPYLYLLLQALDAWREKTGDGNAFPKTYAERKQIVAILMDWQRPDEKGIIDEQNFIEAKEAIPRALFPTKIPANVLTVFEHPLSNPENLDENNANWFWILAGALKLFVDQNGVLPLSGQLPDMTSDSKRYAELLNVYRNAALEDANSVYEFALFIKKTVVGSDIDSHFITPHAVQQFCKNAAFISVQTGTNLKDEEAAGIEKILSVIEDPQLTEIPRRVDPLVWLVLSKAGDSFYAGKNRFPGTNGVPRAIDRDDLAKRVSQLIAATGNDDLIKRASELVPQEAINEMVRYGASEPPAFSAVMGGIVAQEAIKLATHQYLPVDNTFVLDAHSQNGKTIRL
uniref:NEDD8-activating enzyme E1 regulatory subunit n=1 Tax=Panagrellus redivivus TaxID=6233 RepID=A0A7E4VP04_PANRE